MSRHRFGDDPPDEGDHASVVERFTAFNIGAFEPEWGGIRPPRSAGSQGGNNGISIRYSRHVAIEDVRLVGGRGDSRGIGINHNHAPSDVRVEGGEIEGWKVGVRSFPRGEAPIRDVDFDNEVDVQLTGGGTDHRWSVQSVPIEETTFADGGRALCTWAPNSTMTSTGCSRRRASPPLNGQSLYFDSQRPAFVPIPTRADVSDVDEDALGPDGRETGTISSARPTPNFGTSSASASRGEVIPDDAGRTAGVEGGYPGGTGGSGATRRAASHRRAP